MARYSPKLAQVMQLLADWSDRDLTKLESAIAALKQSRQEEAQEQKGCIELKTIKDKETGKVFGTYKYLRYREDGKLKSRYLGKVAPEKKAPEKKAPKSKAAK